MRIIENSMSHILNVLISTEIKYVKVMRENEILENSSQLNFSYKGI